MKTATLRTFYGFHTNISDYGKIYAQIKQNALKTLANDERRYIFTVVRVLDRMWKYVKRIFCIKMHSLTKTRTLNAYRKTATNYTVKYCPSGSSYFTVYSRNGAVFIWLTVVK